MGGTLQAATHAALLCRGELTASTRCFDHRTCEAEETTGVYCMSFATSYSKKTWSEDSLLSCSRMSLLRSAGIAVSMLLGVKGRLES